MTIPVSSKTLFEFYCDWLDWTKAQDDRFYKGYGLCTSLSLYAEQHFQGDHTQEKAVSEEMRRQFLYAGLSELYPFPNFHNEHNSESMHLNPERLAWVKARINEYISWKIANECKL